MNQYIVDDILHILLLICDIDTYSNLIVNKHIYNYCDQAFWLKKLKYYQLPYIKPVDVYVFKSTMYAQELAKQIMVMNKNTNPKHVSKKIIDINFIKNDKFIKIQLPAAFNEALTFNLNNYKMPCECICLKLVEDFYHVKYVISDYMTAEQYLKIKIICNMIDAEDILIKLLYGSYAYKKGYFVFHTYFTNSISISNDQGDDYVVYQDSLIINDRYDTSIQYG